MAAQDWLLLRGLGREAGHWLSFPTTLQAALPPGSRVFCLDNPGCGQERHRAAPASLTATADDVLVRFQAQRGDSARPWSVLGVSLGGMLALELGSRALPHCSGIVVANSSSPRLSWWWERLRPSAALAMLRAVTCTGTEAQREMHMLPLCVNGEAQREQAAAEWTRLATERPLPDRSFWAQLKAAKSWKAPAGCATPMLVLCSAQDRLCAARCSHALASWYGAELREHPSAGHDITTDDGAWVATTVAAWAAQRHASSSFADTTVNVPASS